MFAGLAFLGDVHYYFAGLWPIIRGYSLAGIVFAACIAFAWFSPVFKKTALWVALGVLVAVFFEANGIHKGERRIQAQWDAALKVEKDNGDKIRADVDVAVKPELPAELRDDPHNRDRGSPAVRPKKR